MYGDINPTALVPPYVRKAKSIEAALPWLYLKGISTGEMGAALKMLLGPEAIGFSAKTISRLKGQWAAEYDDWRKADLSRDEWVYVWADGIYSGLRGSDDRLCVLVVIGVNALGEKHFLAIEDGVRESTQSWREVLSGLKARGLNAPKLATGDGAMGFWAALEEVFPTTRQQRCWMHKIAKVLYLMSQIRCLCVVIQSYPNLRKRYSVGQHPIRFKETGEMARMRVSQFDGDGFHGNAVIF